MDGMKDFEMDHGGAGIEPRKGWKNLRVTIVISANSAVDLRQIWKSTT
jgi:hypothetical protein